MIKPGRRVLAEVEGKLRAVARSMSSGGAPSLQMEGTKMTYKTILVHIDSGKRCAARVDVAIRLARQFDAHLVALHALMPFEPPGYVIAEMSPTIIEAQRLAAANETARTKSEFIRQASAAGLRDVEWRGTMDSPVEGIALHSRLADLATIGQAITEMGPTTIEELRPVPSDAIARSENEFTRQVSAAGLRSVEWRGGTDDPVDAMTLHSRYADLVVIGQAKGSDEFRVPLDLPERLVLAAGRPILIVPSVGSFATIGKRILVAWKPCREATRAVTDAIPLLLQADNVHIMAVNPQAGEHGAVPGADIGLYLARHGVRVDVKTDHGAEIDIGNELLSRAADLDADLIVMGGYGHSRLREWALGGATRTILESMTVPVLMSH